MPIQGDRRKIWHNGKWINGTTPSCTSFLTWGVTAPRFRRLRCYETKRDPRSSGCASTCAADQLRKKSTAWEASLLVDQFANTACELVP